MRLPGASAPPPEGQRTFDAAAKNLTFYEGQATKYRWAFNVFGLVAGAGALVLAIGAFARAQPLFYMIVGIAVAAAQLVLQFFQVQNRYVGYRVAAESHREAINRYNEVLEDTKDEQEARKQLRGLADVRTNEVVAWAKSTMTAKLGQESEPNSWKDEQAKQAARENTRVPRGASGA